MKYWIGFLLVGLWLWGEEKTPFLEPSPVVPQEKPSLQSTYVPEEQGLEEKQEDLGLEYLNAIQDSFFAKTRKLTDNNLNIHYHKGQTYKIRLRYAMATSFIFENDRIARYINGDPVGFAIEELKDSQEQIQYLIIKPLKMGIDTNLIVFGTSGQIYTFYLFSTHFTNHKQPIFSVYITHPLLAPQAPSIPIPKKASPSPKPETYEKEEGAYLIIGDGVNQLRIKKAEIQGNFYQKPKSQRTWWSLWLYKKVSQRAKKLQASKIFRDKDYTYFKYDQSDNERKFPVVFRVVDGYDNPLNTKIIGDYIVAEDVGDKFTLRLGEEYVCVERIP